MANHTVDPEKGLMSVTAAPSSAKPLWSSFSHDNDNDNLEDSSGTGSRLSPLQLFQLLVGIHTPPSLSQNDGGAKAKKSAQFRSDNNLGLYERARDQERRSRMAYLSTSFISNTLYMLQIVLAATFTALSAYKDTKPVVLTVLGALNTVVAGCLAWQKGQGVPLRYRKAQDEYQALLFEIEMAERGFLEQESINISGSDSTGIPKLDPRTETIRLQKMFDSARADQQANYPDLYVSAGAAAPAKDAKDQAKELEDTKADAAKVQSDLTAKIEALMVKLEGKAAAGVEDAVTQAVTKA